MSLMIIWLMLSTSICVGMLVSSSFPYKPLWAIILIVEILDLVYYVN
jgi:hypothetical protein